jgi:acyl transferase domain-containing protein/acyl carrier protein
VVSVRDLEAGLRRWRHLETARPALPPRPVPAAPPADGELERRIAALWARILGHANVDVHDNFFDLGGSSLDALDLVDEVQRELGVELSTVEIFEAPTVSAQAALLRPRTGAPAAAPAVSAASAASAAPAPAPEPPLPAVRDGDVAIIALAGRFPGARTLEDFWRNLRAGVESLTVFTDEELLAAGVDPALLARPDFVRARPVLDGAGELDAGYFGFTPREAEIMDPQQRLFLEVSAEALDRAGYDPRRHPGAIGVFAGTALSGYSLQLLENPKTALAMGGLQLMIGNAPDSLTTHVAYRLGLRGPALTVQTHCSTSLVAVHLACRSLLAGECDMALAGGVSLKVPEVGGYVYQEGGQNSPDGHNRSFDARARGTAFGSGLGVVVVKRLADALRDGDTVRAVIKGSAVNNDGSFKIGFTAPGIEGQAEVVTRALAASGVDPETIGYLEAHGSATPLGDPVEVAALTRAFRASTARTGFCSLGSVKANVGHLDRAAGVAGLIKTVLCLEHREIPPVAGFASPHPALELERSPFWIATAARP